MNRTIAVALFVAAALSACDSMNATAPEAGAAPVAATQPWICGREYENYAWGYQRRGVVIDGEGRVWRYDFKGSPASLPNPWHAIDLNNMTEGEFKLRYNGAVDTGKRVTADDIARHMALIREAAQMPPTEGKNMAADMGETTLYCMARNPSRATYRQVLIDQRGDFDRTNPSSAAKALAAWLDGVLKDR